MRFDQTSKGDSAAILPTHRTSHQEPSRAILTISPRGPRSEALQTTIAPIFKSLIISSISLRWPVEDGVEGVGALIESVR